jgi:hypothetical protein
MSDAYLHRPVHFFITKLAPQTERNLFVMPHPPYSEW